MIAACVVAAALAQPALAERAVHPLADALRARLEAAVVEPEALVVDDRPLHAPAAVGRFYQARVYLPAWFDGPEISPRLEQLIAAIEEADRHGLEPADYHLDTLRRLSAQRPPRDHEAGTGTESRVDLELAATDAFLVYASHLLAGRVDPALLVRVWEPSPSEADPAALLEAATASGEVRARLDALAPIAPGYRRLQEALARYRDLAARGGWPAVPAGPKLELGASGQRVQALRERLFVTAELGGDRTSPAFDLELDRAVRRFQERHGLEIDGVVGDATLAALNVAAPDRVRQIALNLERWRWLPRDLGRRHIVVNVPAFELRLVENDSEVMTMSAVVGRPYRRTPIFSATLTYLVVSPYWHVPPGIAVRDILPAVAEDPSYLAERGIRVFQGWGADEREIDPGEIDWKNLSPARFPYRFRQEPGDKNLLGRLKFMFPNRYNVYLHDTPLRELFLPARRDFSSGCIRIERPFDLAEHLLRGDARWNRAALLAAATVDAETTIRLAEPLPVHVLYWTSWVDEETQFREDIYGRDESLAAALASPPATGGETVAK